MILGFYFVVSEAVICTEAEKNDGERQILLVPLIRDKPKAPEWNPRLALEHWELNSACWACAKPAGPLSSSLWLRNLCRRVLRSPSLTQSFLCRTCVASTWPQSPCLTGRRVSKSLLG